MKYFIVQVIGQLVTEINHETQQPAETHALGATNSLKRYPFEKQFSYPLSLGGGNENLLRVFDELCIGRQHVKVKKRPFLRFCFGQDFDLQPARIQSGMNFKHLRLEQTP